jgi:hypothetical protein
MSATWRRISSRTAAAVKSERGDDISDTSDGFARSVAAVVRPSVLACV